MIPTATAAADVLDQIADWLDDASFDVTDHLDDHLDDYLEHGNTSEFIETIRHHADRLHRLAEEDRL